MESKKEEARQMKPDDPEANSGDFEDDSEKPTVLEFHFPNNTLVAELYECGKWALGGEPMIFTATGPRARLRLRSDDAEEAQVWLRLGDSLTIEMEDDILIIWRMRSDEEPDVVYQARF